MRIPFFDRRKDKSNGAGSRREEDEAKNLATSVYDGHDKLKDRLAKIRKQLESVESSCQTKSVESK